MKYIYQNGALASVENLYTYVLIKIWLNLHKALNQKHIITKWNIKKLSYKFIFKTQIKEFKSNIQFNYKL